MSRVFYAFKLFLERLYDLKTAQIENFEIKIASF